MNRLDYCKDVPSTETPTERREGNPPSRRYLLWKEKTRPEQVPHREGNGQMAFPNGQEAYNKRPNIGRWENASHSVMPLPAHHHQNSQSEEDGEEWTRAWSSSSPHPLRGDGEDDTTLEDCVPISNNA